MNTFYNRYNKPTAHSGRPYIIGLTIATVTAIIIAVFCMTVLVANANHTYPTTCKVYGINYLKDYIILRDSTKQSYTTEFPVEDWKFDDTVSCIMHDNFTPYELSDDIVLEIRYSSY